MYANASLSVMLTEDTVGLSIVFFSVSSQMVLQSQASFLIKQVLFIR